MNALIKFYTVSGATLVGGYIIYKKFFYSSNITREQYFQDAIDLLKGYEPAVKNLGNPIKHNKNTFDEKDAFNQITNTNVKLKIPIEGAKKEADLFVFASRPENDPNWNIDSLELKYRGTPSRYKFYDRSLLFKNTLPKPNSN